MRAEIMIWAPSRPALDDALTRIRLPDGRPLAENADGETAFIDGLHVDHIGPIEKKPAVAGPDDDDGIAEIVTDAVVVPGHHANLLIVDPLLTALDDMLPDGPTPTDRLIASGLLGAMSLKGRGSRNEPEGWAGASAIRLYDPSSIDDRKRIWR